MSSEKDSAGGDAVGGGSTDESEPLANTASEQMSGVADHPCVAPGAEDNGEDMVVDEPCESGAAAESTGGATPSTRNGRASPESVPEAGEAHDTIRHPADDMASTVVQLELLSPASSDIPPEVYMYPLSIEVRALTHCAPHSNHFTSHLWPASPLALTPSQSINAW
jgi:hypothetical protein